MPKTPKHFNALLFNNHRNSNEIKTYIITILHMSKESHRKVRWLIQDNTEDTLKSGVRSWQADSKAGFKHSSHLHPVIYI